MGLIASLPTAAGSNPAISGTRRSVCDAESMGRWGWALVVTAVVLLLALTGFGMYAYWNNHDFDRSPSSAVEP